MELEESPGNLVRIPDREDDQTRSFCLKIAAFNALGSIVALVIPMIVDPLLTTNVLYGRRTYSDAHWWCLVFSPAVFALTYASMTRTSSFNDRLLVSWFPAAVLGLIESLLFPPERPHSFMVLMMFAFGLISWITTWIRFREDKLSYIEDLSIPFEARLESLKATATTWQQFSIYGSAGYLAFVIFWASVDWQIATLIVTSPKERFIVGQSNLLVLVVISLCVILGPVKEALSKAFHYNSKLSTIRRKADSEITN